VAEVTIATDILQVVVNPHRLLGDLGTRWSIAITFGALTLGAMVTARLS
jgi:hypothetical protein